MNKSKVIDKPVWIFFILTLIAGILMHFRVIDEENIFFTEYYTFDISQTYVLNSVVTGFVLFWGASIFLYLSFREIFQNAKWAFLAILLFYTSPFIMGVVFGPCLNQYLLTFLLFNFYLTKRFIDGPGILYTLLLALIHSFLILIYPCLIILPILTGLFFLLNISTRNLSGKKMFFLVPYFLLLAGVLLFIHFTLRIPLFGPLPDFSFFSNKHSWFGYIGLVLNSTPPLYVVYFLFSIIAMNVIYFSNYFLFLKNKWIYTYSFIVPVGIFIAEKFIISGSYGIKYSLVVVTVSMLIIAISGCFEFASWVRKRWGEKVYFIFKILFFSLLALQVLFCVIALLYLYPNYGMYRNWPLFFLEHSYYF